MGSIVILDKETRQEICRRETAKTEAQQKIEIVNSEESDHPEERDSDTY